MLLLLLPLLGLLFTDPVRALALGNLGLFEGCRCLSSGQFFRTARRCLVSFSLRKFLLLQLLGPRLGKRFSFLLHRGLPFQLLGFCLGRARYSHGLSDLQPRSGFFSFEFRLPLLFRSILFNHKRFRLRGGLHSKRLLLSPCPCLFLHGLRLDPRLKRHITRLLKDFCLHCPRLLLSFRAHSLKFFLPLRLLPPLAGFLPLDLDRELALGFLGMPEGCGRLPPSQLLRTAHRLGLCFSLRLLLSPQLLGLRLGRRLCFFLQQGLPPQFLGFGLGRSRHSHCLCNLETRLRLLHFVFYLPLLLFRLLLNCERLRLRGGLESERLLLGLCPCSFLHRFCLDPRLKFEFIGLRKDPCLCCPRLLFRLRACGFSLLLQQLLLLPLVRLSFPDLARELTLGLFGLLERSRCVPLRALLCAAGRVGLGLLLHHCLLFQLLGLFLCHKSCLFGLLKPEPRLAELRNFGLMRTLLRCDHVAQYLVALRTIYCVVHAPSLEAACGFGFGAITHGKARLNFRSCLAFWNLDRLLRQGDIAAVGSKTLLRIGI
mmetsp:Transcript_80588/g.224232  ORF Transcript_80588/g.224232 Transcript_80588/m.224232 type:complete len:542 (-) Transcript_80588:690-2315(-)